jgi:TrmH family RNA methyltransferase
MHGLTKVYQKEFFHSYSIGFYPTLELLKYRPDKVLKIIFSKKAALNTGMQKIVGLCKLNSIQLEENDRLVTKLSKSENSYIVGLLSKYEQDIKEKENHVVLVNISDMGNLGTIIRTMSGFGHTNLALIKPSSDIFHPKVIRASMGEIFQLNFQYFNSFEEYNSKFKHNNYCLMTGGKKELSEVDFKIPYSLIFGNEGAGLSKEFLKYGEAIRINQSDQIDSLNLSIAVGITLYQAYGQNSKH